MNRSYRRGVGIVLGTVALSAALVLARVDSRPSPAGQDLRSQPLALGAFRLIDQTGKPVSDASLSARPWIASFIFTRCPTSCPRISAVMKGIQGRLGRSDVTLVSISVDPEHDSPPVLDRYARGLGADPSRWLFLTGDKQAVYSLILDGFKVPVQESSPADRQAGAEAVSHSARLALVAPGNRVVGYFGSEDKGAVDKLVNEALSLAPAPRSVLPEVNASLNGTCALILLAAWSAILRGRWRLHAGLMIAGLAVSTLFLACYLVYHYQVGSVPFRGVGPIRVVYFTILLSHTVLAAAIVPLIAVTVWRAARRRFGRHADIARLTFPIWLYVSITGVVVYFMLYRLDVPTSLG